MWFLRVKNLMAHNQTISQNARLSRIILWTLLTQYSLFEWGKNREREQIDNQMEITAIQLVLGYENDCL